MKITNEQMFKVMEIIGIIGIDIELEGSIEELGTAMINTLMKNMYKAQTQIEELIEELVEKEVDTPIKLMKAIKILKQDKEVVNFFTELIETMI